VDHDAFTDGVIPGGLLNSREIRILICYMLNGVDEPMPHKAVVDIIFSQGMANYFETEAAIEELIKLGNILETEDQHLILTDIGRMAAETLTTRIPLTLRERSVEAAVKLLTRRRRERENHVEFEQLENGVSVTCSIDHSEHPMMSFTLRVADMHQAELIKDRFLNDPVTAYRLLIGLFTGEVISRKVGNRTILEFQ